jgi:hypothetical protein
MNSCNKCDLVKYCNAACKKKHRHKHKKKCEKRAAEWHDEQLFNDHPPREDCPICMLPLPADDNQLTFHSCCGKLICNGCQHAMEERKGGDLCAFCRTLNPESNEKEVERTRKQMEKGNAYAFAYFAGFYADGTHSVPQDLAKANELDLEAGELGCADAYHNLANAYRVGSGVEVDKKKAKHYYELAAINGSVSARYNLGMIEGRDGNHQRAYKHYILAARAGSEKDLGKVKVGFMNGIVTKDGYAHALRGYQNWQAEVTSEARDKARAELAQRAMFS